MGSKVMGTQKDPCSSLGTLPLFDQNPSTVIKLEHIYKYP
jgi:hypothetical protein